MTSCTAKVDELYEWLDQIPFSRQKKNMPRDFSDGVMMAELLKHFYPKLVELHNYSSANCLIHKINNWTTLNRKVFSKIGIKLYKQQIEQLASAAPDAIIHLLSNLRNRINTACEKRFHQQKQSEQLLLASGQQSLVCLVQDGVSAESVLGIPVEPGSGQRLFIAMESMVPQRQLDEKLSEIEEKDATISTLMQKVSHLDTLLQLKDQQIKDLTQQLKAMKERYNVSISNSSINKDICEEEKPSKT